MRKICSAGISCFLIWVQLGCGEKAVSENSQPDLCGQTDLSPAVVHPLAFSSGNTRFLIRSNVGAENLRKTLQPSGDAINSFQVIRFKVDIEPLNDQWQVVDLKEGDREALLDDLMKQEDITYIEPDFPISLSQISPTDPDFSRQWAHSKVKSLDAWELSEGSPSTLVAVIDGGVDLDHPDLKDNIFRNRSEVVNGRDDDKNGYIDDTVGWDFLNNDNDPRPDSVTHSHGTHVAGIIGAMGDNGIGIIGHAPRVRLLPLKFIGSNGEGTTSSAIRAVDYAVKMGAKIINASWSSTNFSQALFDSINRARQANILFVAASGNNGKDNDSLARYPASYNLDNVVSVAASTSSDALASFSNYGAQSVDIAAPGVSIYSTGSGSKYLALSGTSMATPLVSAVAALIRARHFGFSYQLVKASLLAGVDKNAAFAGRVRAAGRVNAYKALVASDSISSTKEVKLAEPPSFKCP